MRGFLRVLFGIAAVGVVLGLLAIAGVVAWVDPLAHASITIDGDQVSLAQLHGSSLLIALIVFVAVLALILLVPLAVVLPVLALLLAVAAALLAVAGTVALVLSPLVFVVWLFWRLARPPRPTPALTR